MNKATALLILGGVIFLGYLVSDEDKKQEPTDEQVKIALVEQIKDMRKVTIINLMDSEAKVVFALKEGDWDLEDEHVLEPQEKKRGAYFMPGTLKVTHNDSTLSVDITNLKNRYDFSVLPDGTIDVEVVKEEAEKSLSTLVAS